jgi:hypothetical protein
MIANASLRLDDATLKTLTSYSKHVVVFIEIEDPMLSASWLCPCCVLTILATMLKKKRKIGDMAGFFGVVELVAYEAKKALGLISVLDENG